MKTEYNAEDFFVKITILDKTIIEITLFNAGDFNRLREILTEIINAGILNLLYFNYSR